MKPNQKLSLNDINGDLKIYFNWSANALMPLREGAIDNYLKENLSTIQKVARKVLKQVNYTPSVIYRGVILKQSVAAIEPDKFRQYLSFSTDRLVAEHFANINGFGSDVMDIALRLGKHGYVIEYLPKPHEILFHYRLLSILPYAEAFTLLNMNGQLEVEGLKKQKEIMILQPDKPFTNITPK